MLVCPQAAGSPPGRQNHCVSARSFCQPRQLCWQKAGGSMGKRREMLEWGLPQISWNPGIFYICIYTLIEVSIFYRYLKFNCLIGSLCDSATKKRCKAGTNYFLLFCFFFFPNIRDLLMKELHSHYYNKKICQGCLKQVLVQHSFHRNT